MVGSSGLGWFSASVAGDTLVRKVREVAAALNLRPAMPADAPMLRRWDDKPHVTASDPHDEWQWEVELGRAFDWRE